MDPKTARRLWQVSTVAFGIAAVSNFWGHRLLAGAASGALAMLALSLVVEPGGGAPGSAGRRLRAGLAVLCVALGMATLWQRVLA